VTSSIAGSSYLASNFFDDAASVASAAGGAATTSSTYAWAMGIHDFGFITKSVISGIFAAIDGEWATAGLNFAAAGGKIAWFLKGHQYGFKETFEKAKKDALTPGAPTFILDMCLVWVGVMDFFGGVGTAEDGIEFKLGASLFETVQAQLELALADASRWKGAAAEAFKEQVTELLAIALEMEDLDRQTRDRIAEQADEVKRYHLIIASVLAGIVFAQGVAILLYKFLGPVSSFVFQMSFAATSIGMVIPAGKWEKTSSDGVKTQTRPLVDEYAAALARSEKLGGEFAGVVFPEAQQTTVGSFDSDMTGASALDGEAPTLASLAGMPGANISELQRVMLSTLSDEDSPTASPAEAPSVADDGTPVAASFGLPAALGRGMNRLVAMSGTAAEISSGLSKHLDVVDQVTSQVEKISGMAQDWQAAATPAEEDTPAQDAETAGAAAGSESAERAPVTFAVANAAPVTGPAPLAPQPTTIPIEAEADR
ncbi:hypothetical protein MAAFP003_4603, partial [Mycobacterium ahvazicum]